MRTGLMLLLFCFGIFAMTASVTAGILCWGAAFYVGSKARPGDSEAFTGLLMVVGGLGAVVLTAVELWRRFT